MNEAIQQLNAALWRGIGAADDALYPSKGKEMIALCNAYLKQNIDAPWVGPLRKKDKKGKPTRIVDATLAVSWAKGLAEHLEAEAGAGRVLVFRADKKGMRGYALMPAGRATSELQRLSDQADDIHQSVERLRESLSRFRRPASAEVQESGPNASQRLRAAYRELDSSGRGYVPIHKLRAAMAMPTEAFDELLRRLRRELAIDLQVGSPSDYHAEEVMNSFMEPDGTLYLTMSWRNS